jgi:hypothetical protein
MTDNADGDSPASGGAVDMLKLLPVEASLEGSSDQTHFANHG